MCYKTIMKENASGKRSPGLSGREIQYRQECCELIIALMADGLSLDACAAHLGVDLDTLQLWRRVHPEFAAAVRQGWAASIAWWELRSRAVAEGEPGNARHIQWALQARSHSASGWSKDAPRCPEDELVSADASNCITQLDVSELSNEEMDVLERALRKSMG